MAVGAQLCLDVGAASVCRWLESSSALNAALCCACGVWDTIRSMHKPQAAGPACDMACVAVVVVAAADVVPVAVVVVLAGAGADIASCDRAARPGIANT